MYILFGSLRSFLGIHPENSGGTRIIICSMNMGDIWYLSDTASTRTRQLCRPSAGRFFLATAMIRQSGNDVSSAVTTIVPYISSVNHHTYFYIVPLQIRHADSFLAARQSESRFGRCSQLSTSTNFLHGICLVGHPSDWSLGRSKNLGSSNPK